MGRASQQKGARGELEWRDKLKAAGFRAERRGYLQRYRRCDLFTEPDVYSPDLDGIHFEVKNTARPSLGTWLSQAERDCGERSPVVVWKRTGGQWVAILSADRLLELLKTTRGKPEPKQNQ